MVILLLLLLLLLLLFLIVVLGLLGLDHRGRLIKWVK